jgi:arylsulfatase A-like enzyme
MSHAFCRTIDELEARLAGTADDPRPVFAHTRPLDLHIGNVWSAKTPTGESYPGFFAPYAARVRRVDACFGGFVEFLRRERFYDDSIIIVTADHGDSLGEGLRWGHGFTAFPEVLRIPLVVHLPDRLASFTTDPARVSFTLDITPTLYALLGDSPTTHEPQHGVPLFARSIDELADREAESFLVASSYGPVYGLLSGNGTRLYIADAINGREYGFDLSGGRVAGTPVGLTDDQRNASRREIRDQVEAIADGYGYRPTAGE